MAAKQLTYSDEARQKLLSGVSKLARAVRCTLGPRGRNAVLDKGWGSPTVTKDGVTVAEEIELTDPYENMGAQLVKEAASKTSDVAGDGTTTATVLAEAIYREGLKMIAAGSDPMALTRGIQKGVDRVVDELARMAEKIDPRDEKEITEVATIASNNNAEIGKKLAEAMKLVGATNGVITIEEGNKTDTEVVVVQGMQFDRGYLSPHFVTNQETVTVELENPYILIYEEKISSAKDLIPLLETISKKKEPLLIIAEDIEGDALVTLVLNKLKGILQVAAVKAPGYGDRRKAMLEDIATLTGGKAIFKDLDIKLESIQLSDLGRAKKVKIDAENTTITEGAGDKKAIKGRCDLIRREISTTDSEYDREKLQERLAKLAGGVARVKVGAATETEMKERKALYEDALHATRAALAEGIVPGGGVALLQARKALDKLKLEGDQALGVRALQTALDMPARMIAENAGLDGSVVVANIRRSKEKNYGYDADKGEYTDLRKRGIVDPVKVTRSALQHGASVACLLLTTESMVADIPEKGKKGDHHDYHGGGMGGRVSRSGRGSRGGAVSEKAFPPSSEPPSPPEKPPVPPDIPEGESEDGDAESPSPPEKPPVPPQGPEEPRRFLQARFPQHVRLKDRVVCLVRVGMQSDGQASTPVPLDVPPEGTEVLFVLHTPGFLAHSDVHQTIFVPAAADSRWATFEIEAQKVGVHTLEVTAFHKGTYLGTLPLQITVDNEVPTGHETDRIAPFAARMLEPGEVTLLIRYDQDGHIYRYQLFDGRVGAQDEICSGQLLRTPQEAVEQMVREMNDLARGGVAFTAEQTRQFLKGRGISLWQEFIPDALQTLFWGCRDDIRRLIILSAGDPVPWEVFYPFKPGGFDAGFLAEQFPVARWRFGPPPLSRLRIAEADFVWPGGSLPAAEEEITAVRGLFNGLRIAVHPSIRDLTELLQLFNDAHFNLLHFACHNAFRPDTPDASRIMMGAVPFQPLFLNQHMERFRSAAPLVFMNACRTGGESPLYTRLAGWAHSFLAAGAGAFVGSLWEVRDGTARRFAEQFYDTLLAGQNLGQALSDARAAVRDEAGDPTWLAYTMYGDPAATVSWEG